jgi:tRNA(adenine34) deaminase
MQLALAEARKAERKAEVPIGAILIDQAGDVLAASHNQTITLSDPTAHAEVLVMRSAAQKLGNYRLLRTSMYVTVEPCVMCMGALIHARVERVVFGAQDPKWGAAGSLYHLALDERLNHQPEVVGGICESACREMMQQFFRQRRQK